MDYFGLRACEQNESVNIGILYRTKSLYYDTRFRKSSTVQNDQAISLGLVTDQDDYLNPVANLPQSSLFNTKDAYEHMNEICTFYLTMEPQSINMTNDNLCDHRRESFRYWLAVKTALLRFSSKKRKYSHHNIYKLYHALKEHEYSNPSMKQLFRNFISLPREVTFKAQLAIQFGLPVIAQRDISDQLTEEWLLLTSLWKIINVELHPTLCEMRYTFERQSFRQVNENNFHTARQLRLILDRCSAIKSSFPSQFTNFLMSECVKVLQEKSNFPRLKITRRTSKTFIKNILQFTTNVSLVVIKYLAGAKIENAMECLAYLTTKTKSYIVRTHDNVKKLFRHKFLYSNFEIEDCQNSVLRNIEIVLREYQKKKFNITPIFGGRREIQQKKVHRLQKFLRCIMNIISSAFVDNFCKYYTINMKKEYTIRVIKNLILHVSWTAMNIVLNEPEFTSENTDKKLPSHAANPLKLSEAEKIVSTKIMYDCVVKTCEVLKHCEAHIFGTRSEVIHDIQLPLLYVYNDFTNFHRTFSEDFSTCAHLISDLDMHTNKNLKKIMIQMLVCLHNNMPAIDEVLQITKEYLRYIDRCKLSR